MRIVELTTGLNIMTSNEEAELLSKIGTSPYAKAKLDIYEQELANKMVSKGLLTRVKKAKKLYYVANTTEDDNE